jgi:hypothetical protein
MQGKKQRLRAKMSKPSGLLPSMCPEKGAFVLHTTNVRFPAVQLLTNFEFKGASHGMRNVYDFPSSTPQAE